MTLPFIGMRNVKTAVAIGICLTLSTFFDGSYGMIACFSAVICMQDSIEKTLHHGVSRLLGTGVGGVIGIAILSISLIIENKYLVIPMIMAGASLALFICNLMKRPAACTISCTVLVIVAWPMAQGGYQYAVMRILETAAGVGIAVIVNLFLPDFRKKKTEKALENPQKGE